jgi:adenosylcobinamide-GDP ribazoletransferase
MAALGWWLPYARADGGLGAVARGSVAGRGLAVATASSTVLLAALAGWHAAVFGTIAVGVTLVTGRAYRRRIGGFTGDTLGATGELTEAAVWLAATGLAA